MDVDGREDDGRHALPDLLLQLVLTRHHLQSCLLLLKILLLTQQGRLALSRVHVVHIRDINAREAPVVINGRIQGDGEERPLGDIG